MHRHVGFKRLGFDLVHRRVGFKRLMPNLVHRRQDSKRVYGEGTHMFVQNCVPNLSARPNLMKNELR